MKTNRQTNPENRRIHRAYRWIGRRRNLMMTNALRGTSYGIGAGAVGLLFWWWEQKL